MGILEKPSQARVCCPPFVLPLASMGILGKPSQARVRCPPFVLQLASLGVPGKPSQVVSLLAILCLKVLFGLCFPFRRNHSHSLRHPCTCSIQLPLLHLSSEIYIISV
ncbi:hypothetical protein Rs2_35746 [Raphanus sativus]|nr:hypothetical protein Rs2_35746 [Raphanus sativus]